MPTVFSALSPIKHSPPAAATTFGAVSKENASVDAYKSARGTRKPAGPRSPGGTPPGSLRGHASKENAHAHARPAGDRPERRRSQALRDVTQDGNVSVYPRKAEKEKEKGRAREADRSADTSKDSVRSRMKEWERERERLREMERLQERMREVEEEDREREREAEREREKEWERERCRVEAERQQRLAEMRKEEEEEEREVAAETDEEKDEDVEEPEPVLHRERPQREYILPKISVGPALTPAVASPLSPLFEGTSNELIMLGVLR